MISFVMKEVAWYSQDWPKSCEFLRFRFSGFSEDSAEWQHLQSDSHLIVPDML